MFQTSLLEVFEACADGTVNNYQLVDSHKGPSISAFPELWLAVPEMACPKRGGPAGNTVAWKRWLKLTASHGPRRCHRTPSRFIHVYWMYHLPSRHHRMEALDFEQWPIRVGLESPGGTWMARPVPSGNICKVDHRLQPCAESCFGTHSSILIEPYSFIAEKFPWRFLQHFHHT